MCRVSSLISLYPLSFAEVSRKASNAPPIPGTLRSENIRLSSAILCVKGRIAPQPMASPWLFLANTHNALALFIASTLKLLLPLSPVIAASSADNVSIKRWDSEEKGSAISTVIMVISCEVSLPSIMYPAGSDKRIYLIRCDSRLNKLSLKKLSNGLKYLTDM